MWKSDIGFITRLGTVEACPSTNRALSPERGIAPVRHVFSLYPLDRNHSQLVVLGQKLAVNRNFLSRVALQKFRVRDSPSFAFGIAQQHAAVLAHGSGKADRPSRLRLSWLFFFQAEHGIRDH